LEIHGAVHRQVADRQYPRSARGEGQSYRDRDALSRSCIHAMISGCYESGRAIKGTLNSASLDALSR
jgi:hypothetical protein